MVFLRRRPPVLLKNRVHPLLSLTSPSESVAATHLPDTWKYRTPPLGFPSPSRHQHSESTCRRASTPDYDPPSAFLTLSTVFSSAHLAGLFHPTATFEIRTSGSFPAAKPARLIDVPCPLVVGREAPPGELPHRCQILTPRLQGFDPGSDPLRPTGGLGLPTTRFPLGLSTPSGFSPGTLGSPSRPLHS